ncbi:MAG: FkbM family methyltransferase [Gemmatimonadota bacterium]|nr:FkbM family methyltransferase [Gemmatimonadota bacterium]
MYDYIVQGVRCTLVEPDPDCVLAIREHFAAQRNVTLHPVAVYDLHGRVELVRRAASTFVAELTDTPATVNDRYRLDENDKFVVEARTFDEIDDGTIDLLSVDAEGSEWFVIKHMTSRPSVISVETHGSLYRNPYLDEISQWMKANNYVLLYKATSDSVFVKRGVIEVNVRDKIEQALIDVYLSYKRAAKRVKHATTPR